MKNRILIALAFSIGLFSFSQKKELKTAEKAIKKSNYAEAKTAINQAETMLSSMDDKSKNKFYLLKSQALYANGAGSESDIDLAVKSLNLAGKSQEVSELFKSMVNTFLTKGNDAYEGKDYATTSNYFEKAYRVSSLDTTYLYYAASTAVNAKKYDDALRLYSELNNLKYTGIVKQFTALNKETNEVDVFNNSTMRDISVKTGTHIKPKEKPTESKSAEIVKNIALIYVQIGENEKAVNALKNARLLNPNDSSLLLTEANMYYKMGNTVKFKELLEEATAKDPNNPELQYNLGVIAAESGDKEAAKKYYTKAIELDPKYSNAQINMAAIILSQEEAIIEEMNGLGSSAADDRRYEELQAKRQNVYKEAIPYLEAVMTHDANNLQAAKTLMGIYSAVEEDEKFKAIKEKVEMLEAGN